MQVLVYDGSFAGFLCAVFDTYEYRYTQPHIVPDNRRQDSMFTETHIVATDDAHAQRVWNNLGKRLSKEGLNAIHKAFLSEREEMEDMLLRYMQYAFASATNMEQDFTHPAVRYVADVAKQVHREKHRMEAFVRFQHTNDGLYYATIEPDFNVVPLLIRHFSRRYADQRWLIYDVKRKYGIYYDLQQVEYVSLMFAESAGNGAAIGSALDDTEVIFRELWKKYFNSVNIPARKNLKMHIQHMPRRYWKYLPEKH